MTVSTQILPHEFYDRSTLTVAQELLGAVLVRMEDGVRVSGIITETEAYVGESDLACHAKAGKTPRTAIMYGQAGNAYVYLNYGIHWMLNAITERDGFPAAVLIRAIQPLEGIEIIASRRRTQSRAKWTDGPSKLAQALGIAELPTAKASWLPGSSSAAIRRWSYMLSPGVTFRGSRGRSI